MLVYIQSIIAIILAGIASITDFKNKKIYNKTIIIAICISIFTYIICWRQIEFIYLKNYLINLFISGIIAFIFFCFRIWAAGDAKLFFALVFMIPYEIYEVQMYNIFPAIYIMIMIFSIAFIYVVLETIFLWIKDDNRFEKIKIFNSKINYKDFFINYIMGYSIVLFVNNITYKFFEEFRVYNSGLMILSNMLLLIYIYTVIKGRKKSLAITSVFLLANIIYYMYFGFSIYSINFKMLILVLLIMIFRSIAEKYNYEEIKVEDLKSRMILSTGSVLEFYGSRVKGLPQSTTENTDSRLNQEQVESIKRWSKTKKGKETIVIVRHMPFAPFMLLGVIMFFILKLYS